MNQNLTTLPGRIWQKLTRPETWAHDFRGGLIAVSGEPEAVAGVEAELHEFAKREPDSPRTSDSFSVGEPFTLRVDTRRAGICYASDGDTVWPFRPSASRVHREWMLGLSAKHVGAAITYFQGLDQPSKLVAENGELRQETAGKVDFVFARGTRGQLVHPSATKEAQDGPRFRIRGNRHSASGVEWEEVKP